MSLSDNGFVRFCKCLIVGRNSRFNDRITLYADGLEKYNKYEVVINFGEYLKEKLLS